MFKRLLAGLAIGCVAVVGAIEPVEAQDAAREWSAADVVFLSEFYAHTNRHPNPDVRSLARRMEVEEAIGIGRYICDVIQQGSHLSDVDDAIVELASARRISQSNFRAFAGVYVGASRNGIRAYCPQYTYMIQDALQNF